MRPLHPLALITLVLAGCAAAPFGVHGTERFTEMEHRPYAGVNYSKEGEISRWTLRNPSAIVEHRPLPVWTDHASAAGSALRARANRGWPEAVKTEADREHKYTVTAAIWPGTGLKRRAIMIVAEAGRKGGGYLATCEGEASVVVPQLFGAYCKHLLRPVVRIARRR